MLMNCFRDNFRHLIFMVQVQLFKLAHSVQVRDRKYRMTVC